MQGDIKNTNKTNRRLVDNTIMLVNLLIVARYLFVSVWVTMGFTREVLTNSPVEWPVRVIVVSSLVLAVSLVMLIAVIRARKNAGPAPYLLIACLVLLGLFELYESLMLHIKFGPMQIRDVSAYIYGPLLLMWAAICAKRYLR